jgi:4-deoxy-L-threo-5-hexosulose-uronate ketol-isomerase
MHLQTRHTTHPEDTKNYTTGLLRHHFLIEEVFAEGEIMATYTLHDRMIAGGAWPGASSLSLGCPEELKAQFFLERREMGIINVGGPGSITVDGQSYLLLNKEALYIGRGSKEVLFHSENSATPALFYFNSAPAHTSYPVQKVTRDQVETVYLGTPEQSNVRTIYKLLVAGAIQTCQVQMGLTELQPGSNWNTMPPHTHDRRMEVYFYFDLAPDATVCHFMGTPHETRHIWMKNHQAVISPPWSIHSGVGTNNYSFIWGMAGENLDYGDMDHVKATELL